MINFLVPAAHGRGIRDYLDVHGAAMRNDFHIIHCEDLIHQKELVRGTYVMAALDQLGPGIAGLVLAIYQQLKDTQGFRFLNNPETTLQRFDLLSELNKQGLNEFRALRATSDRSGLTFPVFIRSERLHEGALSPLLNSENEVRRPLGKLLFR